jgi:hypothetical protein
MFHSVDVGAHAGEPEALMVTDGNCWDKRRASNDCDA